MDCKLEMAARSLVRIEVLALQGLLYCVVSSLMAVLQMPWLPFREILNRAVTIRGRVVWLKCLLVVPVWFAVGVCKAVANPIMVAYDVLIRIGKVVQAEWENRWMASIPKKLNGCPMKIPTPLDRAILDEVIEQSVIRDYGGAV